MLHCVGKWSVFTSCQVHSLGYMLVGMRSPFVEVGHWAVAGEKAELETGPGAAEGKMAAPECMLPGCMASGQQGKQDRLLPDKLEAVLGCRALLGTALDVYHTLAVSHTQAGWAQAGRQGTVLPDRTPEALLRAAGGMTERWM